MLDNLIAGVNKSLELNPKNKHVLLVSSDIPALKSEMVDWLINTCMETSDDIYYGVCPREVMEARYPGSKRTYTKLKDMEVCGADINVVHVRMASEHLDVWDALIANRKNPVAASRRHGFGYALFASHSAGNASGFCGRASASGLVSRAAPLSGPMLNPAWMWINRINWK